MAHIWNVPFERNPFFTGREAILASLHGSLQAGKTSVLTQPQSISGLGGIGKTQTAVEYTYRHRDEYQAVLWMRADSALVLTAEFVNLAALLDLPEKDEENQSLAVAAVMRWLREHTNWLLIFDNADDINALRDFLPSAYRGHILLTTRARALGTLAHRLILDTMDSEIGSLLLLRRASIIPPGALLDEATRENRQGAMEISRALGGLPLALDQAAAYIEEIGCGLAEYLALYQEHQDQLLRHRGGRAADYPASVATTWSLSFEKVSQARPRAADLLAFYSFLYPDAIPEEIIAEGAPALGTVLQPFVDSLELNAAIRELLKFSLLQHHANTRTLSMHRLVQTVLRQRIDEQEQKLWAEQTVFIVDYVFPSADYENWSRCQRYLPHAQLCVAYINQWKIAFPAATGLLSHSGDYLKARAQYPEAEECYRLALSLCEQLHETAHPDTAGSLNNLAALYRAQGRYDEAEPLYGRALEMREQVLGPHHSITAGSLNDLAVLYYAQGRYEDAEPLYLRALKIRENILGLDHPETASVMNNLAALYFAQGHYAEAEALYRKALEICERTLGIDHPDTASSINNLAELYYTQGRYPEAEPLYLQNLDICERLLGPDHPDTASSLNNLALLYRVQGRYAESEPLHRRDLAICERVLGHEHPDTAQSLNNLAELYREQGRYNDAEPLYIQALEIREHALGPEHPDTAISLNNLALCYQEMGRYAGAEPLYLRSLSLNERILEPEHPEIATVLNNLALLYRGLGRHEEAESFQLRDLAMSEHALGPEHPDTATSLNNLGELYFVQGKGLLKNNFPCNINAVCPKEKPEGTEENRAAQMESGEGNGSIRNSPVRVCYLPAGNGSS